MNTAALDPASPDAGRAPRGGTASRRMCVVCRRKAGTDEFVQLKQAGFGAGVPTGRKHGRGAYVCIAFACLRQLQEKTLERALKAAPTAIPTGDALLVHLRELAESRLLNLLGLARRCGTLVCGVEAVQRYLPESGGFYVMATDLADRSANKLASAAEFVDGFRMGQAVGIGFVGAMGIRPGRLARQAAYWLRLWYETNARSRPLENKLDGCAGDGNGRGFGQSDQKRKPIEVA